MTGTWRGARQGSAVPRLTLGEAVDALRREPIACACPGSPWCCLFYYPQAKRLQRGAHILVKMIDELAKGK